MATRRFEVLVKSRKVRRTAATLSAGDWRLVLLSWLMLLRTSVAIRFRPALRNAGKLHPKTGAGRPGTEEAWALACRFERAVRIASHGFPRRVRCLGRSLALGRLLADRGVSTALRIGVRREDGRLEAHAWLEFDERPIGEPGDIGRDYAPLAPGMSKP